MNLLPFLKGDEPGEPHDVLYWRLNRKTALRAGDWKILQNPGKGKEPAWELYNLAEDVAEQNDLSAANPEKTSEMMRIWEGWDQQMIDPIWSP